MRPIPPKNKKNIFYEFILRGRNLKNFGKFGKKSKQGVDDLPISQPLNRFLKKYLECPETHNKYIKHFFIFRGVGPNKQ